MINGAVCKKWDEKKGTEIEHSTTEGMAIIQITVLGPQLVIPDGIYRENDFRFPEDDIKNFCKQAAALDTHNRALPDLCSALLLTPDDKNRGNNEQQ